MLTKLSQCVMISAITSISEKKCKEWDQSTISRDRASAIVLGTALVTMDDPLVVIISSHRFRQATHDITLTISNQLTTT